MIKMPDSATVTVRSELTVHDSLPDWIISWQSPRAILVSFRKVTNQKKKKKKKKKDYKR